MPQNSRKDTIISCLSFKYWSKTCQGQLPNQLNIKNVAYLYSFYLTLNLYEHFGKSWFQQRLSYTTLSDLAQALIDGTVYEIVQGLLDIQHLTEKNLYNQRQKLHTEHRGMLVCILIRDLCMIFSLYTIFLT